MNYFQNPNTREIFGYDPETQRDLIEIAIKANWIDITDSWPPAPDDEEMKQRCSAEAKRRLRDTDYSQYEDVIPVLKNKAEFDSYRAIVRGFLINPVTTPVWPQAPKASWF